MKVSGHFTLWLGVPVKSVCPLDRDRKGPRRNLGMWANRRDCGKLCKATVLDTEFKISCMYFVCCICGDNIFVCFLHVHLIFYVQNVCYA
jgi:hypothetical protein